MTLKWKDSKLLTKTKVYKSLALKDAGQQESMEILKSLTMLAKIKVQHHAMESSL